MTSSPKTDDSALPTRATHCDPAALAQRSHSACHRHVPSESDDYEATDEPESSAGVRPPTASDGRHVLLTRSQAARRMGVSVATVRRMEGEELQPIIVDGKHCFASDDLDRYRKVSDGDLAAQVFDMFNADKTPVDVVIALKQPPERVRKLFQDWAEMSECLVAGPPGIGRRQLQRYLKKPLTRRMIWVCLNIVMRDSRLKAMAATELGYELG